MHQSLFCRRICASLIRLTAAASLLLLAGDTARAGGVSWTDYSVVTIGTPTMANPNLGGLSTSSEITGNAFISGNVTGSSFTMASDLPGVTQPTTNPQYALSVVGNLDFSNDTNINEGYSVIYAGQHQSGNFNFNSGGHGGGSLYHDTVGTLSADQKTLSSQITSASSAFTNMATTGTVSPITSGTVTLDYTGAHGGVAVFDLSASTLTNGSLQRLNLVMNGASSVVIDVTGLSGPGFSVPNTFTFEGAFTDANASKIIWNFGDLTGTLQTNNMFLGSIIAPDATFTNQNYVDGSIFVQSYLNGQGEIHYANNNYVVQYDGFNPLSVPEPSSIVLAGFGMIGAGLLAWRRRAAARASA
jgi:choice-of-anchor A domain-containing protein